MSLLDALLLDPHPFDLWIAYRSDGIKGSGTLNDPYDGSTAARLDGILSTLPSGKPVHVHLGPSPRDANGNAIPFLTGGFWISSSGVVGSAWQPKPNMVLSGAGREVTVLRLAPGTTSGTHYFAIGASTTTPVDFFELSSLTVDCNLPTNTAVACGAVRVMGNHVRIRNVKCVNWGSRTTAQPGFVIALIIADPESSSPLLVADNAGVEDCIAVSPSASNTVTGVVVNILHAGGREVATSVLTQFGRAPFIRNCFVDCDSPTTPAAEFRALSMGACKGGIVEGNQVHNTKIGGPYQEVLNTDEIIVRNNTYRNVIKGPYWNLGVTSSIGVQRLVVEGNHIQLIAATATPTPIGIQVEDRNVVPAPPPYVHGQVVIRNNKIRYVDGASGSFNGYGIDVAGVGALIVSDNIADLAPANPITNKRCGTATYFNNRTPGGVLIRGVDSVTGKKYDELETEAEDALVMGMFNER